MQNQNFSRGDTIKTKSSATGDGYGKILKIGPDHIFRGNWTEALSQGEALIKWFNDGNDYGYPQTIVVNLEQYKIKGVIS